MRIVGGDFRGRKLRYVGDPRVRPMKDRVREALFNLLGPDVKATFAIDLFGGTGALALEAISRGSNAALIVEQHLPTAKVIQQNISLLGLDDRVQLVTGDIFHWHRRNPKLPADRWVVFCSPPYRFFTERVNEIRALIENLLHRAPDGSLFAVEGPVEFNTSLLPDENSWDIRSYPPAVVAVSRISHA